METTTVQRMTLEEIAAEIGISRTTIYKVIRNKGYVSDRTREIVIDALYRYNYVENRNARNLAMNKQYTIGYVGFRSKSAAYFSKEVRKGIDRAIREFGDDGLAIQITEFDVEKPEEQLIAVEQMLADGIRSFVLAFSDVKIIHEILSRLQSQNCLVVLLSRDFEENTEYYYMGVDYYQSGILAAELMGKMLPEGGDILVPVTGEYRSNHDIHERLRGFTDKIQDYPQCRVLPVIHDLVEEELISDKITKSLVQEKELKGIFDLTYRQDVIAGVLQKKKRADLKLIGFDLFNEIVDYVKDGTIDAVVYQDLKKQAFEGFKMLFDEMCYGRRLRDKKHYSKLEVVMGANLPYFL